MTQIKNVQKRDGTLVPFEQQKITEAIWKAAQSVGGTDRSTAEKIANQVTAVLEVFFKDNGPTPSVEQIQDLVEKILIEDGHAKTAKAYIIYREEHKKRRADREAILGAQKLKLTTLDHNSKQLGDFIVLDIKDDLEAIFEGMKQAVIIHQNGEKACVNFSALRPQGSPIKGRGIAENKQKASGPTGFMKLYDEALNSLKTAQGKHVMLLNVTHPDIKEFLTYEQNNGKLQHFALMVEVNEAFLQQVEAKEPNATAIFEQLSANVRDNSGPKPLIIEHAELAKSAHRKHSSVQVNLPFYNSTGSTDNTEAEPEAPKPRHTAQEITLPPIETLV